ncbi:hypothetical protein AGLY_016192 [Aphis glycines]|uniref:Uncharacterized protein n=1 Tax=Aphis glycines TaxID=307491 RepID=A0A6G0SZ14_APHGL|nr:hypothetical protein AGLY_016192 [Aphis glycines]
MINIALNHIELPLLFLIIQSCKSSIESDVVMLIPLYAECNIDTFLNNGGTPSTSMTEIAILVDISYQILIFYFPIHCSYLNHFQYLDIVPSNVKIDLRENPNADMLFEASILGPSTSLIFEEEILKPSSVSSTLALDIFLKYITFAIIDPFTVIPVFGENLSITPGSIISWPVSSIITLFKTK